MVLLPVSYISTPQKGICVLRNLRRETNFRSPLYILIPEQRIALPGTRALPEVRILFRMNQRNWQVVIGE